MAIRIQTLIGMLLGTGVTISIQTTPSLAANLQELSPPAADVGTNVAPMPSKGYAPIPPNAPSNLSPFGASPNYPYNNPYNSFYNPFSSFYGNNPLNSFYGPYSGFYSGPQGPWQTLIPPAGMFTYPPFTTGQDIQRAQEQKIDELEERIKELESKEKSLSKSQSSKQSSKDSTYSRPTKRQRYRDNDGCGPGYYADRQGYCRPYR